MKIGGDYRIFPFHNTWGRAAAEMGIDTDFAFDRVRELTGRVAEAFAEAAADPDVVALGRDLPGRLVDIIADRAARCKQLIDLDRGSRVPSTTDHERLGSGTAVIMDGVSACFRQADDLRRYV